ncbi:MAG TPA: hypothetical protein VNX28_02415 [Gemmataceae bacterium]|jgi:hypothetical protein|nr:hypothetical protein [Gemmataceae bacterium]
MVREGQRLALGLEAGQHCFRIHARLDELDGHLAPHRVGLLRNPNSPHASLANLLQQFVTPAYHHAAMFSGRIHRLRKLDLRIFRRLPAVGVIETD